MRVARTRRQIMAALATSATRLRRATDARQRAAAVAAFVTDAVDLMEVSRDPERDGWVCDLAVVLGLHDEVEAEIERRDAACVARIEALRRPPLQ